MRCDNAFRLIASQCLADVAANHAATCTGDPEALHHMRVALTKLRAAVTLFSPMVEDAEWTRLKSELKWFNGYLGATRDLDVAIEHASDERAFKAARKASLQTLEDALRSARYQRWIKDSSDWAANGSWSARQDSRSSRQRAAPIPAYLIKKLDRWHEKLVKRSRGLRDLGKHKLHKVRIASKRLRYAIEFAQGALPKEELARWRVVLKTLRKGQQILGELNDAHVRRLLVSRLEDEAGLPPDRHDGLRLPDRKKSQLLRRAAEAYKKIAA